MEVLPGKETEVLARVMKEQEEPSAMEARGGGHLESGGGGECQKLGKAKGPGEPRAWALEGSSKCDLQSPAHRATPPPRSTSRVRWRVSPSQP